MVRLLASTKLTVALCLVLALAGAAGSLLYQGNTAVERQGPFNVYRSPLFLVPAALLILNILVCAAKRFASLSPRRLRSWTFAGIHLGIVLLAAGLLLDGAFGFVGTKYYYQGVPESAYTDWRRNRQESFPFTIEVTKTVTRFHPLNLQVGIRDGEGRQLGVYTAREGVAFPAGKTGIVVVPRAFDTSSKTLLFDVRADGRTLSNVRAGVSGSRVAGGYVVAPVAYADPEPMEQTAWVRFTRPGRPAEQREIRVNAPATFDGILFCLVAVGADRYGNPYAGLQMTREPGGPVFWAGALLFGVSLLGRFAFKRASGTIAASAVLLLFGAASAGADAAGTLIAGEQVWRDEVRVTEPVIVEKGATLRIRPETRVLMSGQDRDGDGRRDGVIRVEGTLLVEGESRRPVRFLRLRPDEPWGEVFLKDAVAVIRHAVFEGAEWGLHVHDGDVSVEQTVFRRNGGGAKLKGTGARFTRCTFRDNGVGLRFWEGGPALDASSVVGNGTGLFYREGSGGGRIRGNRFGNREWNLKIGDWAAGDLDVSGNYWGAGPSKVGDFREKKGPGRVLLAPALPDPPDPCGADGEEDG